MRGMDVIPSSSIAPDKGLRSGSLLKKPKNQKIKYRGRTFTVYHSMHPRLYRSGKFHVIRKKSSTACLSNPGLP